MKPFPYSRIVVTGGAGFLGQPLVSILRARGAQVVVPRSLAYDLRRAEDVARLYDTNRPDLVIHLAAVVGGIGANRANPGRYFYDNAMMGLQMVEAARRSRVAKFVAIGTICAYPKFTPVPFREDHLWDGYPEETNAPYGLAKKMMLVQLQAYRQQYNMNGIYLLPVNLYGPGDNFDLATSHVIPAMIRKFWDAIQSKAPTVTLWGTGEASREFLYVDDCAAAIVAATERYDGAEPVNVGSGREVRIRDLATMVARLTGYQGRIQWDRSQPDGQPRRCLDVSRAKLFFGFEPAIDLEIGLRQTVDWWRKMAQDFPPPAAAAANQAPNQAT